MPEMSHWRTVKSIILHFIAKILSSITSRLSSTGSAGDSGTGASASVGREERRSSFDISIAMKGSVLVALDPEPN